MIRFLLKGLLRDSSRSRLPVIVVTTGVMLTVFLHAYINGFMGETIEMNARFYTGHLKVMTRAYADNMDQIPNDLALSGTDSLTADLMRTIPGVEWSPRIHFGGIVDVPDKNGETRSQGPALGLGVDLLTPGSPELHRLNLKKSLARGTLPAKRGEVLLSEKFAQKLHVNPGEQITVISSTMDGSMTFHNFNLSGTVSFGHEALDRGSVIADIGDIRYALDMENAAGEIAGFFRSGFYNNELAVKTAEMFNKLHPGKNGDFTPVMVSLSQQGSLDTYVNMAESWSTYISMIFVFAMSLVLWNAGLLGGLRRYGEFGVRLAMGEEKSHVYRTLIYESVMIGIAGSITGTAAGLFFAWLLQKYGIDFSGMMKGSAVMLPSVLRARISSVDFYIGFIPGLISTLIGTMLSGIGIYKRQTALLFKELEA
jgi:putative ABC transport system permease protein